MKDLPYRRPVAGFATACCADIQDPPSNDYGPTRKLGRGLSNMVFGWSEIPVTIAKINKDEGNSAAAGYGVVRGVGRGFARFGAGLCEAPPLAVSSVSRNASADFAGATSLGFTAVTRNSRLSWATNRNTRTCGIIDSSSRPSEKKAHL